MRPRYIIPLATCRNQRDLARAIHHYNRARHLRPAYLETGYFFRELAGVLYLAGHYGLSAQFYRKAARLEPDAPDINFLLGDAMLLAGSIAEARSCFGAALARGLMPWVHLKAELKMEACDYLISVTGSDRAPRGRAAANSALRADGRDTATYLEHLLKAVDAFHPLARFNLGILRAHEGDLAAALHHFLLCAFIQPHDIVAWSTADLCFADEERGATAPNNEHCDPPHGLCCVRRFPSRDNGPRHRASKPCPA